MTGDLDLLGPPRRVPRTGSPRWLAALVGASAFAVVATGTAAAVALAGSGGSPADVLPADAVAVVSVDFDPGARQKLALFQLSRKLPALKHRVTSADSLRDDLLRSLLSAADGLSYDADVKPWIGDRAGVAALPSGGPEPDVVVAVQYTDRDKAQAGLAKAERAAPAGSRLAHAFVAGSHYVLLGEEQAVVDHAAKAHKHLADDPAYTDAVDALDGDQLLLLWADAGRVWDVVPVDQRERLTSRSGGPSVEPSGQLVAGVHASSNAIELTGAGVHLRTGARSAKPLSGRAGDLLAQLPSETVVAVGTGGLGEALASGYDALEKGLDGLSPDTLATLRSAGVRLPDDLVTLLGREDAIAVSGSMDEPHLAVRTRTDDPARAAEVGRRLLAATGAPGLVQQTSDGVVLGTDVETVRAVAAGGDLGRSSRFARALPDVRDASLAVYVDLARALASAPLDGAARDNARPLDALGLTVTGGSDGRFRLRVTFR